jgi:hypothetical protein
MSAAAAVNPPLPSPEGELADLKGELTAAKAKLEKWSDAVEKAPIDSPEEKKAKEREAIYSSRVTALEGQIAGKYYSFLNKHQRTNRSHH